MFLCMCVISPQGVGKKTVSEQVSQFSWLGSNVTLVKGTEKGMHKNREDKHSLPLQSKIWCFPDTGGPFV